MHITRESIFVGAIRAFCTTFAGLLGIAVAIVVVIFITFMLSSPNLLPSKTEPQIVADAQGNREMLPLTSPIILKIDIQGVIGEGHLIPPNIESALLDSREGFFQNRVKGILLHIDSPGGYVLDADAVYRAITAYKKKYQIPVYAYVDGLCASGGMYIASSCDQIFATAPSIIGSVGVIVGPAFNFSQAMEKYGIQSLTLTEGKDKDMLNPFRPWQPGEDISLRNIMTAHYHRFIDVVVAARPRLDREALINTYGAQVYIAEEAQKLGFIDHGNSSYQEALTALVKASGIEESEAYQVVLLEKRGGIVTQLLESNAISQLKGTITHRFEIGPHMISNRSGKFLYLYQPESNQ